MDFLGGEEATAVRKYVELLEARLAEVVAAATYWERFAPPNAEEWPRESLQRALSTFSTPP